MSNDISPTTPLAAPINADDGRKKNAVNHEEFGNETEMDDLRKAADEQRIEVTPEDDRRLRMKVDKRILIILCWVYFLQILDKTVFGYGNVFGMSRDTNLADGQYSQVSIMNAIAQIAWQPFSSYLIVKVPSRILMTALVFCWGVSQTGMAAAQKYESVLRADGFDYGVVCGADPGSYGGLVATRFLLGLFESGCLPLFGVITAQWYRRSEQPIRVAAWYSTNGIATMFSAILAYGLGHSTGLAPWRALFLTAGLMTVLTAPVIWLVHDSSIETARFYTPQEKEQATERLRANQTGTGSSEFKWHQVLELFYDTKTYLWLAMSLLLNVGAAVTNIFGPTLIGNFGFDDYTTCLLNIPFGFLQLVWILVSSWAVHHIRLKSAILAIFIIPVVVGLALLYSEAVGAFRQGPSLAGYYLLSFLFGGNPLIVSWIAANTAGQTKKTAIFSLYNAGVAIGNIIGPLLFKDSDSPRYVPGLRGVLGIFIALLAVIGLQVINLYFLNKVRQNQRVKHGKPKFINDTSMSKNYVAYGSDQQEGHVKLGQNALLDLTDYKNDEFVYLY